MRSLQLYGVHRSTVTRAAGEIWPLLAAGGFTVPASPGVRLKTLPDVFAYAAAEGVRLRIDGTEVQVGRPAANRPGRRTFVSGEKKQNTIMSTVRSDGQGRLLWLGAVRPGRMHDVTALRTEGIEDLLRAYPDVQAEADRGYQGLARDFPAQISALPRSPARNASPDEAARWGTATTPAVPADFVEHAIAETETVAESAALPQTPRPTSRRPPGHRRAGLRPRRHAVITSGPSPSGRHCLPQSCTHS